MQKYVKNIQKYEKNMQKLCNKYTEICTHKKCEYNTKNMFKEKRKKRQKKTYMNMQYLEISKIYLLVLFNLTNLRVTL